MLGVFITLLCIHTMPNIYYCSRYTIMTMECLRPMPHTHHKQDYNHQAQPHFTHIITSKFSQMTPSVQKLILMVNISPYPWSTCPHHCGERSMIQRRLRVPSLAGTSVISNKHQSSPVECMIQSCNNYLIIMASTVW